MPPGVRLPGIDKAVVTRRKIRSYLLALDHPTGQYKAHWLMAHGFRLEGWISVATAIKEHAAAHEVADVKTSAFGRSHVIDGSLMTPDGRNPLTRAIWFIEIGDDAPKLVTVYPLRRRSST